MSKATPNVYVNNIFGQDDGEDYEDCFSPEEQSDYEDVNPIPKSIPLKLNPIPKSSPLKLNPIPNSSPLNTNVNITHNITNNQSIQDNFRSQKKEVPWRLLLSISFFLITIIVSNVITFVSTQNKFLEKKTKHLLCSSLPCLNGGSCVNAEEQYYCSCTRGFSGKNCEVTPCTGFNCLNGGSCDVLNGTFHCLCKSGFIGMFCEVTPCTGFNCLNGGSCEVLNDTFHCLCKSGFTGMFCEVTTCTGFNCLNGGSCEVLNGNSQCLCKSGFAVMFCEDEFYETITPPGYPSAYSNNIHKIWKIDVGVGNTVRIKFTDFALEQTHDYVKIHNAQSTSCCSLGTYTGTSLPTEKTSTGRYMTIVFRTDHSATRPGFRAVIFKITSN